MSTDDPRTPADDDTDVPQVPVTDDLVIDLLEDSREVAGVLGYGYPVVPSAREGDLTTAAAAGDASS